jgi:hypothetical protein
MNEDTGIIRQLKENEKLEKNEVKEPNPLCPECHGTGSHLIDLTKDVNYANRATRRHLPKGQRSKYVPCSCTRIS